MVHRGSSLTNYYLLRRRIFVPFLSIDPRATEGGGGKVGRATIQNVDFIRYLQLEQPRTMQHLIVGTGVASCKQLVTLVACSRKQLVGTLMVLY